MLSGGIVRMASVVPYRDVSLSPVYISKSVVSTAAADNKDKKNGQSYDLVSQDRTSRGDSVVLSRNKLAQSDKDLRLTRQTQTQVDRYFSSLDKLSEEESSSTFQKNLISYGVDTESLKDQYSIPSQETGFVPPSLINKYKEAQAYRYWKTSTMETYI